MRTAVATPPPTPVVPVTETLHGLKITDPYRWLEDQNSPRTRAWLEEQRCYTRSYLNAIPRRNEIRNRVEELLSVESVSDPWHVADRYFYLKRQACNEQPVIAMVENESGKEVVLVDPALMGQGSSLAVSILSLSRDGSLLAYGIRRGGLDSQSVEFLDVGRRQVLPDRLPHCFWPQVVFSADGQGFYYSLEAVDSGCHPHYRAVYWHSYGTPLCDDTETFFAGDRPNLRLAIGGSSNGKVMIYLVTEAGDPKAFSLYLHNLFGSETPRKIVEGAGSVFGPFFVGDRLFALTDWEAPNLRIVALDLDSPSCEHWLDIVPESQSRIRDFAFVGNCFCVGYLDNGSNRIEVFDLNGRKRGALPCPPHGTVRMLRRPIESDRLFYSFSSVDQAPTIYSYDPSNNEHNVWARSHVSFDPTHIQIERIRYKSRDGTEIPMVLVGNGLDQRSGSRPTLLTGYGGFSVSPGLQFNIYSTFLIERGFLLAVPDLRGGGDLGGEWHRAGRRQNRQHAFDDFIAAAEWLVAQGHTTPDKIAIAGGSNAGLLVGAAMTQRPELFRAVVCLGPMLDMVRYHLFNFARMWIEEYGTPEQEDDFHNLLAYSPYHRVKYGVPYPSVMFISGDADTRCNPLHARKMAARLQAATSSGHPVLIDYKPTWGHVPVQPLTQRIEALTDRLAFICHELAVSR
jgi:prolyl oligopeptidase